MSLCKRFSLSSISFACLALVVGILLPASLWAQQTDNYPKVEIFAGYSYYEPGGHFDIQPNPPGPSIGLSNAPAGWGTAVTYNFNKNFGFVGDFGGHYGDNNDDATITFGPQLKYRGERWQPFGNILFGIHRLSPSGLHSSNGFGLLFGGGLDVKLKDYFGLRLFEADFVHGGHHDSYLPLAKVGGLNGARVQTGLMFFLGGGAPPAPATASCSVNPTEVFEGEPVTANATANGFNPKHPLKYDWSATGGKITGKDATAQVDTTDLQPGSYTVTANITDTKSKKRTASCNATYTIKERPKHPPEVSCSANPTTVQSGTPSTITCNCTTPDSGPEYKPAVTTNLTNWTASGGKVSGTGNTATLDTAGASAGPITVTATCTDSRGLSGNGTASVNVEVPPPPPQASKINTCDFPSKTKPARVDNTCKAVLDDVALRLQREADARAVVVGNSEAKERGAKKLAEDRAVNTKTYLTKEKGIDPSRIDVRSGSSGTRTADVYLVPQGATFNEPGTEPVTEKPAKAPAHKRAKKAPAKAPGE